MLDAEEVVRRIRAYAERLEEVSGLAPTGLPELRPRSSESLEVCVEDGRYLCRWHERGTTTDLWATADLDEFLRLVLADVVRRLAGRRARLHPDPYADPRRAELALRVEWLGALEPAWGARERERVERELVERPFEDPEPAIPVDVPLVEAVDRICSRLSEWYQLPVAHDEALLARLEADAPDRDELLFRYATAQVRAVFDSRATYAEAMWGSFWVNGMKALDQRWAQRVRLLR